MPGPCTVTSNVPQPFRPVFNAPPSADGSSTSTAPQACARSSINSPRRAGTDLLVGAEEQLDTGQVVERRQAVKRLHDPGEHVEHAGPGHSTVGHRERPDGERPEREHRVVVAEEQHLRSASTRPVHVGARHAVDQRRRSAEQALDHGREHLGGGLQGGQVERRRLDLDQRAQVVEHRIEGDRVGVGGCAHVATVANRGGRTTRRPLARSRRSQPGVA